MSWAVFPGHLRRSVLLSHFLSIFRGLLLHLLPMDKQMFVIGSLWVFGPVGCFISFSWPLQSQQGLRIFAFAIFCELKVPALGEIMLATQSSMKDIAYLVFPGIKQFTSSRYYYMLSARAIDFCCESSFTSCHLGQLN